MKEPVDRLTSVHAESRLQFCLDITGNSDIISKKF